MRSRLKFPLPNLTAKWQRIEQALIWTQPQKSLRLNDNLTSMRHIKTAQKVFDDVGCTVATVQPTKGSGNEVGAPLQLTQGRPSELKQK